MTYLYIKRGFWEALDRIRALYAYRDGYSFILVTFRKKQSEENMQNYTQTNHTQKTHTHLSCARKLYKEIHNYTRRNYRNFLYKIAMNKTKVEIYTEVLRDISQNFEGREIFVKQQIEEICKGKKCRLKSLFNFIYFLFFYFIFLNFFC